MQSHSHELYQLVLPINGHIEIELTSFNGKVGVGEGICIAPHTTHSFRANALSKFIVADLEAIPSHLDDRSQPIFQVNKALQAYLNFVEVQLTHFSHHAHQEMVALFVTLLEKSAKGNGIDKRITPVLSHIHQDLAGSHSLSELADVACLSETQFKKHFKNATGVSLRTYLVNCRMEMAKALLRNTDTPMLDVALSIGYEDVTAFSRRFKAHYGRPPSYYKRK